MGDVAIGGTLPVGDHDGLTAIAADLIAEPGKLRVMLAVIDVSSVKTKTDSGDKTATVRIRRIEQVIAKDLPTAEKLIRRALEARMGRTTLPLDLEDEISAAFAGMDPAPPEGGRPIGENGEGDEPE